MPGGSADCSWEIVSSVWAGMDLWEFNHQTVDRTKLFLTLIVNLRFCDSSVSLTCVQRGEI